VRMLKVFFLLGTSLTIASAAYRSTIWYDPRPPSGSEGFVLYASDYADHLQEVHLLIDKIQVVGEASSAALELIWAFRAVGLNSTLAAGMRVPRDAEMQEAQVVMFFKNGTATTSEIRSVIQPFLHDIRKRHIF
jgi:hypothetical protein